MYHKSSKKLLHSRLECTTVLVLLELFGAALISFQTAISHQ